jgi:propanol-preferring alcohol dehydrogenase
VVPEAYTFASPDAIEPLHAAPLLCAGVIGYRAFRLSEATSGCRLGLFGFGASAHLTIQIATHLGCKVYVFTRSGEHQDHARERGADWAGALTDDPPAPVDHAIVFAPAGRVVHDALRVLAKGGTLAINAVHMTPIPEISYDQIYFERTIRTVANLTREDARGLLELAASIPLRSDVESHALEDANHVLLRLKNSEVRGAAVLDVAL